MRARRSRSPPGASASDEAKAKAKRCVARKGCKGKPADCEEWDACLTAICDETLQRQEQDCEKQRRKPWATSSQCTLVHADACAGVVATVCGEKNRGPVHEARLKPSGR
jgi:hypothetical protein